MDIGDATFYKEIPAHHITPRVKHLSGRKLAQTAVRRELIDVGTNRSSQSLVALLPLAKTLGVAVAEMQRLTSYSRQTIYNQLNSGAVDSFPASDTEQIARALNIALVAAGQGQTLKQIGQAVNASPEALLASARFLTQVDLATLDPGKGGGAGAAVLTPTDRAVEWLRLDASSRELADRRPGFSVYMGVPPEHLHTISGAAQAIVGLDEAAILPADTAPSFMTGPELAVNVRAADRRSALRSAEAIWKKICEESGLSLPMRVTEILPPPTAPNAPSPVLDSFLASLSENLDPDTVDELRGERERYPGGVSERKIAASCLTWAARELRRALGREDADRLPTITSGDDAFEELIPVSGQLSLSPEQKRIKDPLEKGLKIAAERLGPFRGGELGAFKGPEESPQMVREVAPSAEDLLEMARLSGEAINAGGGDRNHVLHVLRAVLGPEK